ncbi:MAG: hypothetical protein IPO64_14845 [Bacteroidetes bacterium]|nr:hypothetical protein [Bacteroidota bacterium]
MVEHLENRETDNSYLICSYSSVRYNIKTFYEMNKQIEKAKQVIRATTPGAKLKFTQAKENK